MSVMGNIEFKLNPKGVGELLKCEELQDYMQSIGEGVASRAGEGYAADTRAGKKRAHTFVKAVTKEAYFENLNENTLLKALQS